MKHIHTILLVLLLILPGCVTSRGDLFERVTAPVPEDTEEYYDDSVDEADDYTPGIEIKTSPSRAEVYFNRSYRGRSSVFIDNPDTGEYFVRITREGYYPVEEWVRFEQGSYLLLTYDLEEITGFLDLEVEPAGARILIDGMPAGRMPKELQIGSYTLEAELFGYHTWKDEVTITEDTTTRMTVTLETAPFAVSGAYVSRSVFNPGNPGAFGKTVIRFYADNRGSAEVDIIRRNEEVVRTLKTGPFTQRVQTLEWDGRDDEGRLVPEGAYTIRVRALGDDGTASETAAGTVVDSSLIIQPRPLIAGLPGLLYCPTPDILPAGTTQISVAAAGASDGSTVFAPVQGALRFTLPGGLEGTLQGTLLAISDEDDGYSFGAGMKHPLAGRAADRLSLALGGKLTYQGVRRTDTLTNFTALSFSLPAGLFLGPLKLYLTPELAVSCNSIDYNTTATQTPGLYVWAYGRAGCALEIPGFTLALSAALRTLPFSEGFALHVPVQVGSELHFILPGSQFFASLYGLAEIEDLGNYYILFGGGFHFIF